jgi:D-aminopeptidase
MITKWAIHQNAAICLTPRAVQKGIQAAAERALGRISEMKPYLLETPIRFEIELTQPIYAHLGAEIPGVEQIDGRTLACTRADIIELYPTFNVIKNLALSKL